MPEDRTKREETGSQERLPEVPETPSLPSVPNLKPTLPPHPNSSVSEEAREYRRMGIAYTIPSALIAPIIVLTLVGYWLDERLHKSPYFTLGGALLGTITGFINMIRMVNKLNK